MSSPTPSKISAIYRHLVKQIGLALPCHKELFDTEDIDENPPELLNAGYGVVINEGENTNLCISSQEYFHSRTFVVLLTRDLTAIEGSLAVRTEKWLSIMEDLHQVMKRLARETSIVDDSVTPAKVISFKSAYATDSGPRSTWIKGQRFVFIELTVTVEYREPTTGGNCNGS